MIAACTTTNLNEVQRKVLDDVMVSRVMDIARRQGVRLYLVGGTIRDIVLGREPKDYDFVVSVMDLAFVDQLGKILGARCFRMGRKREGQVYRLVKEGRMLDFTAMAGNDIHQDLMRRDFTINAIAYSFDDQHFYAASQAWKHMKEGKIDLLTPHAIEMDPLRMLRAIRTKCTLAHFDLTARLKKAISRQRSLLEKVAAERIRTELDEIMLSPHPGDGLRVMHGVGLLTQIFPEMSPLEGLMQGDCHSDDALSHTIAVVDKVMAPAGEDLRLIPGLSRRQRLVLGYGALFHDLGKPATRTTDERGAVHFYGHPEHSVRLAEDIMVRLKFPKKLRDEIFLVVKNHMRVLTLSTGTPGERALRRLINALGPATLLLLHLGLAELEAKGTQGSAQKDRFILLCQRVRTLYEKKNIIDPPQLLKGVDLLELGFEPGPRVGEILREVRQRQIDGELKSKEEALVFIRETFPPSNVV